MFSRSKRLRLVSPVFVAVAMLGVLVITTTTSNAAPRGDCQYRGTVAVPASTATGIAGGKTYTKAFCGVVAANSGAGGPAFAGRISLVNPWVSGYKEVGTLKSSTGNWFACSYPYNGELYVLTQGDTGGWGWLIARYMDGTPGDCGKVAIAAGSDAAKKYTSGVAAATGGESDSIGSAAPGRQCTVTGKKVKVPAGVPAGYGTVVAGKTYPIAVCFNKGGQAVRNVPGYTGVVAVDTLISTQSFFACGVSGGGQTWLLTQGDEHLKWGWLPAQFVTNTVGGVSENAYTPGVVHC